MAMQQEVQILAGVLFSLGVLDCIQPVKGMMDKADLQIGSTQPMGHVVELPLPAQPDVAVILRAGTTPGRVEAGHAHPPTLHIKQSGIQVVILPVQLRSVALHELTILPQALHRRAVIFASAVKALIDGSDMLPWFFGHLDQASLLIVQYFPSVHVMVAGHHEQPLSRQPAAFQQLIEEAGSFLVLLLQRCPAGFTKGNIPSTERQVWSQQTAVAKACLQEVQQLLTYMAITPVGLRMKVDIGKM
ncbi:hypothetical protein WT02_27435 [Burkholderia stagnalis]|nr:hypothetical protein WT02_27435 [Burkholderia stagnalis]KVM03475.1 hypothetical protein WT04_27225 [Burkholderia stagnalis]